MQALPSSSPPSFFSEYREFFFNVRSHPHIPHTLAMILFLPLPASHDTLSAPPCVKLIFVYFTFLQCKVIAVLSTAATIYTRVADKCPPVSSASAFQAAPITHCNNSSGFCTRTHDLLLPPTLFQPPLRSMTLSATRSRRRLPLVWKEALHAQ
jgi:hypothetical protein